MSYVLADIKRGYKIKTIDKNHREKNLLIRNKLDEINGIILTIQKQDKEPIVELVKSYLRKDRKEKKEDTHKELHFLPLFTNYEKWIKGEYNPQRDSTKFWIVIFRIINNSNISIVCVKTKGTIFYCFICPTFF
jgi:hypothetical protein